MADPTGNPDVERRINEHLEAIDRALAARGVPLTERRSITGDVEAQIRDMLAAKAGDTPTAADVEAVLRKLDAPESYAEQAEGVEGAPVAAAVPAEPPRVSRLAVIGATVAPLLFVLAFVMAWVALRVSPADARLGPSWWQVGLRFTLLPLGMALPFLTTVLGWIAVTQIRRSNGRLCGLGLALADGLLFPLLVLDVLIAMFWRVAVAVAISWQALGPFVALGRPSYSMVDQYTLLIFVLTAVTALVVDWLILRWAWCKLSAPAKQ